MCLVNGNYASAGALGSLCGRAALLLEDLIENDRERRDGSEERAKNLRDECVLGGQFAEGHEFCNGQNLAFYHAALILMTFLFFFANSQMTRAGAIGSSVVYAMDVVPLSSSSNSV